MMIYFLMEGKEFEDGYADEEVAIAHTLEELKVEYLDFLKGDGKHSRDHSIKMLDTVTLEYLPFNSRRVIEAWNTEALELGIIEPPKPFGSGDNALPPIVVETILDGLWQRAANAYTSGIHSRWNTPATIPEGKGRKIEFRRFGDKDTP